MLESKDAVEAGRDVAPPASPAARAPAVEPRAAPATPDRRPATDLEEALSPMLEAVVHFAGAAAGAIRISQPGRSDLAPVVFVGPGSKAATGSGVLARWCDRCAESADPQAACVRAELCRHDERLPSRRLESVCRHVLVVPLHHGGRPVGMLDLVFDAPCELPPGMPVMLQAAGDLIGVSLDNARLADEMIRVVLMNERQRMASEVHDSLAQGLTYMRMRMSLLNDAIRQHDELRAYKYWGDIDDAISHSHAKLRELITCFRSRMDARGLVRALEETAGGFFDRTGVQARFECRAGDFRLDPGREVEIFHIANEALANVARHAQARHVLLTLDRIAGGYELAVQDDGVGIVASAPADRGGQYGHHGLAIMRERAARIAGDLVIEQVAGRGTRVRLRLPEHPTPSEGRT